MYYLFLCCIVFSLYYDMVQPHIYTQVVLLMIKDLLSTLEICCTKLAPAAYFLILDWHWGTGTIADLEAVVQLLMILIIAAIFMMLAGGPWILNGRSLNLMSGAMEEGVLCSLLVMIAYQRRWELRAVLSVKYVNVTGALQSVWNI